MKHITQIPLYIRGYNTNQPKSDKFEMVELPIGTEVEFIKHGDENKTYSSDPVYANCYSGETDEFSFDRKWLFKDPNDMWSFYDIK